MNLAPAKPSQSRCTLLLSCLMAAAMAGPIGRAQGTPPALPMPEEITQAQAVLAKVEATPWLAAEARQEARKQFIILKGQFDQLWLPLEQAYAGHQADLAGWQDRKRKLSKRNADHGALPHQFKLPDQAAASAAYQAEADRISGEMTALNKELKQMSAGWKEKYAALSEPVETWLQSPALAGFTETAQGLLDGRLQFQSGVAWAQQKSVQPRPPVDTDSVVVDSRKLITPETYATAKANLARLDTQSGKLAAKLEQVRGWEKGLNKDYNEFEEMRREAQKDLVFEFLDHVPVAEGLKLCEGKDLLTAANVTKIEAGYAAMKALISEGRGITAKENPEKFKLIMDGNLELTNAMQAVSKASLTEEQRKWLDGFGKVYSVSVNLIAGTMQEKDKAGQMEKVGKVLVDIGEVVVPAAGVVVLTANLSERGVKYWSATKAQESLGDALSSNWNAGRYLNGKLEQVNTTRAEVRRQVDSYESLHPPADKPPMDAKASIPVH